MSKFVQCTLITANIGSIFEFGVESMKQWINELFLTVSEQNAEFIALHCQEVGGKNYEQSLIDVENFTHLLISDDRLNQFDRILMLLDEDYSSKEHYTALGNMYFIHKNIQSSFIWNFVENQFEPVIGKQIHSGNIDAVKIKEKSKFPKHFFPESEWSRKGYLRTRWCLGGIVFDLVNVHLFHDMSNFVAIETSPSIYALNRQRALKYVLDKLEVNNNGVALFLFGDFNFRMDAKSLIEELTKDCDDVKRNVQCINYYDSKQKPVLTIAKKSFIYCNKEIFFTTSERFKKFDREPEYFHEYLFELPITFPPSYPFEENIEKSSIYMSTRCPAWCDRIMMNSSAHKIIYDNKKTLYGLIGLHQCMGDHKPVCLKFDLIINNTDVIINITDYSLNNSRRNSYVKIDGKFLHGTPCTKDMLKHDPYTPESHDSPFVFDIDKSVAELLNNNILPPTLLKEKLESYLKTDTTAL